MPPLEMDTAKETVVEGLETIADFQGDDIENFTFEFWHDFHKTVFVNAVAAAVAKRGSRLVIQPGDLDDHPHLGAFITHVYEESAYLGEPESDMRVVNGNLRA